MTSDEITRENVAKRLHEVANQLSAYNDGDTKALVDDLAAAVLFMRSDAHALAAAQAEIERLREALECGKNLIEGEAVGAEWKKKCLCFIRKANTALGKEA